jgi:Flp pilus assembly pilin Flp
MHRFKRLLREDSGQDMVEYGLLSAFISIVAIVTLKSIKPLVAMLYIIKHKIAVAT